MTTTEPVSGREKLAVADTEDATTPSPDRSMDVVATQVKVEPEVAAPPRARRRYMPGLDGMRGVAMAAMLLYHHGVTFVSGAMFKV